MTGQSVLEEQGARVAAYVDALPEIGAIQEHAQHAFIAACMSALARLHVADHMDGVSRLEEIATRTRVDRFALERILRFMEPYGFYELEDDRLKLTAKGRMLRSDNPMWSGLALCGAVRSRRDASCWWAISSGDSPQPTLTSSLRSFMTGTTRRRRPSSPTCDVPLKTMRDYSCSPVFCPMSPGRIPRRRATSE
jgi:hypothetical protein